MRTFLFTAALAAVLLLAPRPAAADGSFGFSIGLNVPLVVQGSSYVYDDDPVVIVDHDIRPRTRVAIIDPENCYYDDGRAYAYYRICPDCRVHFYSLYHDCPVSHRYYRFYSWYDDTPLYWHNRAWVRWYGGDSWHRDRDWEWYKHHQRPWAEGHERWRGDRDRHDRPHWDGNDRNRDRYSRDGDRRDRDVRTSNLGTRPYTRTSDRTSRDMRSGQTEPRAVRDYGRPGTMTANDRPDRVRRFDRATDYDRSDRPRRDFAPDRH